MFDYGHKTLRFFLLSLLLVCSRDATAEIHTTVQFETGAVWQNRNDVRIPVKDGTFFEFDKLDKGPFPHYRLNAEWSWGTEHGVRFVAAPFRISVSGDAPKDIDYNGVSFLKDDKITVNYMFDSYRIGYFYEVLRNADQMIRIGGTGKIRSARIELEQGERRTHYTNTGFVPLFYVGYEKAIGGNWSLYTDMDFAAAPQGRAFDLTLKAKKWMDSGRFWGFGYRTLEGGADNDKVVTWSWFNYFVLDYAVRF